MKYIIVENLEDHTKYNGQEVEIIKELENDYFEVTDGVYIWTVGAEEIRESKTNVQFYLATYEPYEADEQPYKEVLAVFVDEIENVYNKGFHYTCYAHLGQHSTCSLGFLAEKCKKATETEYQDLKTELESIGYNLNIL